MLADIHFVRTTERQLADWMYAPLLTVERRKIYHFVRAFMDMIRINDISNSCSNNDNDGNSRQMIFTATLYDMTYFCSNSSLFDIFNATST